MRELHVVALSEDGRHVVLATRTGTASGEFRVALDERLTAAVRGELAAPGSSAPPSISPREIQARLRNGEAPEQIAASAGVPLSRVERYAGPVLAELDRIISGARAAVLARPRLGASALPLAEAVEVRLAEVANLAEGSVQWSARRTDVGRWVVEVSWTARGRRRTAGWHYDLATREVVAVDGPSAVLGHVEVDAAPAAGRSARSPAATPARGAGRPAAGAVRAPAAKAPGRSADGATAETPPATARGATAASGGRSGGPSTTGSRTTGQSTTSAASTGGRTTRSRTQGAPTAGPGSSGGRTASVAASTQRSRRAAGSAPTPRPEPPAPTPFRPAAAAPAAVAPVRRRPAPSSAAAPAAPAAARTSTRRARPAETQADQAPARGAATTGQVQPQRAAARRSAVPSLDELAAPTGTAPRRGVPRAGAQTPDGQTPDAQTPDGQTPDAQTPDSSSPASAATPPHRTPTAAAHRPPVLRVVPPADPDPAQDGQEAPDAEPAPEARPARRAAGQRAGRDWADVLMGGAPAPSAAEPRQD